MHTTTLDRDPRRLAHGALRVSMLEGALHAVMVGVAESYFGAFAVELGHGPEQLAVLGTLPLFTGACCQLLSPLFCAWLGGRKRVVVAGAIGQTLSLAAYLAIAVQHAPSLTVLLLTQLCFWVCGGAMAPAWNAWMANLTLHTDRQRYFGLRSALNHLALLVAFGAAGFTLQSAGAEVLDCFAVLFAVAVVARASSVVALLFQRDLEPAAAREASITITPQLGQALVRGRFRVPVYLATLALGTQLSAPFFTPYMLRELELDYATFAGLSALSILAKVVTFPCCPGWAERFGLRRLLSWAGLGVAAVPILWASSARLEILILAHVLGGVVWAAVEYSSHQLLLEGAPSGLTAEYFSLSSAFTGVGQVLGALAGGYCLRNSGASYSALFALSGVLRGVPLAVLLFDAGRVRVAPLLRELNARALLVAATPRSIFSARQLPRALGNRTTDPPPAL